MVEVRSARVRPTRRRNLRILEATVADDSGSLKAIWFNQAWLADRLGPGPGCCSRPARAPRVQGRGARDDRRRDPIREAARRPPHDRPRPRPPGRRGGQARRLREWTWSALALAPDAIEPLPAALRERRGLPGAADACVAIHFPREPRGGRGGPTPARLRGALPAPGGARCRRGERGAELRGVAARSAGRAGRALARLAAVRADRRTSGPPARRSTPTSAGDARCSGC